jgi:hypothetical protein
MVMDFRLQHLIVGNKVRRQLGDFTQENAQIQEVLSGLRTKNSRLELENNLLAEANKALQRSLCSLQKFGTIASRRSEKASRSSLVFR